MRKILLFVFVAVLCLPVMAQETDAMKVAEERPEAAIDPFDIWGEEGVMEKVLEDNKDVEEKTALNFLNVQKAYFYLGQRTDDKKEKISLYERSLEWGDKGLEKFADEEGLYYYKAAAYGKIGETKGVLKSLFLVDDIKENCQKTLEINPDHPGANLIMGKLYRKLPGWKGGDIEKSLEHLIKATELEPNYSGHWMALANSQYEAKQYSEAKETLEKIINADEGLFRDKTQLGKDKKEAAELMEKVLKKLK